MEYNDHKRVKEPIAEKEAKEGLNENMKHDEEEDNEKVLLNRQEKALEVEKQPQEQQDEQNK